MEETVSFEQRKYLAVSVKHTQYLSSGGRKKWRFGDRLILWGHLTETGKRCYGGYKTEPLLAERYALGDMKAHGYGSYIKDDEPVKLCIDFCKKYASYDTVLVAIDDVLAYYQVAGLPLTVEH
jgi:hypothetical protein